MAFENDEYYWYLHPLFEQLHAEAGEYIDLYDNAAFEGAKLDALERMLGCARSLVSAQPEAWRVCVGIQDKPRKTLFKTVHRDRFLTLLGRLEEITRRARETGGRVVCFGD